MGKILLIKKSKLCNCKDVTELAPRYVERVTTGFRCKTCNCIRSCYICLELKKPKKATLFRHLGMRCEEHEGTTLFGYLGMRCEEHAGSRPTRLGGRTH